MMNDETVLNADNTFGLGEIRILHPSGTFALTPASFISIGAIGAHRKLLAGKGLDWGSGSGCLSIMAAKLDTVESVTGLEISQANVDIARRNARLNGVGDKVDFIRSDSYSPCSPEDARRLESLVGHVNFILANPPSSEGDDGFGYRREVLKGARRFLVDGGFIFLNISAQYGSQRIDQLCQEIAGIVHRNILASTGWVPFDLERQDLLHCLELYAQEEDRGGVEYAFQHPENQTIINAQGALQHFRETGASPLSKWQTHLFEYSG